jgi:hypothetical protein
MRRDFSLPPEDAEGLNAQGWTWETICEENRQWLVVRGWSLPDGYNKQASDVALLIGPSYPTTQIDMAYFHPVLLPANGKTLKACDSRQAIEGKQWQRWSRHRVHGQKEWREGIDNVVTHLIQVRGWLVREVA